MKTLFQNRWVGLALAMSLVVAGLTAFELMDETRKAQFFEAPMKVYPAAFFITGWAFVLLGLGIFRTGAARQRAIMAAMATTMFSLLFIQSDSITASTLAYAVLCIGMISYLGLGIFPDKPRDGGSPS